MASETERQTLSCAVAQEQRLLVHAYVRGVSLPENVLFSSMIAHTFRFAFISGASTCSNLFHLHSFRRLSNAGGRLIKTPMSEIIASVESAIRFWVLLGMVADNKCSKLN